MWHSHMFWRLFGTFGLLLLAAIGGLGAVVLNRVEHHYEQQLQERLHAKALLVSEIIHAYDDQPRADLDAELKLLRKELQLRVTLIDNGGKVLLDSDSDAATMDDHSGRPEIVAARESGFGSSTRFSHTLNHSFGYAAIRMAPTRQGVAFVRIAVEIDSIEAELATLRWLVWTTVAVTALLAM